jgi:hypothetical protein
VKTKHIAHKLTQQNVLKRVLWAYGIYIILSLVAFAIGYLLLPEGALRGSAIAIWGEVAAQQTSFWSKFLATIGFNLGIASLIGIVVNLQRVNGLPAGYVFIFVQGILSGIVAGTNSFVIQVISPYTLEGWLVALRIGYLEFLGYVCIVAATIGVGLRNYTSWLPWKAKEVKVKSWRDIRLSRQEIIWLVIGILLILVASYNEAVLAFSS